MEKDRCLTWLNLLRQEDGAEELLYDFGCTLPQTSTDDNAVDTAFEILYVLFSAFCNRPVLAKKNFPYQFFHIDQHPPAATVELLRLSRNLTLNRFAKACPSVHIMEENDEQEIDAYMASDQVSLAVEDLMGSAPNCLPKIVCERIPQIKVLSLENLYSVPQEISNLQELEELSLEGSFSQFPEAICKLSNLKQFTFSSPPPGTIPESIGGLSQLQTLDLHGNDIDSLPDSIGQCSNLRHVNLAENSLKTIPDSVLEWNNLEWLDLSKNQISHLPNVFGSMTKLNELLLKHNVLKVLRSPRKGQRSDALVVEKVGAHGNKKWECKSK